MKASRKSTSNQILYILIAVVAIGGIAALTYTSSKPKGLPGAGQWDSTLAPVQSNGYVLGSASAPIEVTEFGDFECPQCSRFATLTEPDVRTHLINTGQVRWRYIDFPLPMHGHTWNASRAAACADEQGKFWPMHDAIYQTQDQWNTEATGDPDKVLRGVAQQIGLKMDQYDQCVDSRKYQAKIQAHYTLAEQRGVNGTPTFFIGNDMKDGFLTYDQFTQWVGEELAKQKSAGATGAESTSKK